MIDHLVLVAPSLDAGAAYVREALGVDPGPGGEHPRMGTHNRLLSLGVSYLEVIAVNPAAPAPGRPRWFGLDTPVARPRLAAWVMRKTNPGEEMSRGPLRWRLTWEGVSPALIEWLTDPPRLPASGCVLERLDICPGGLLAHIRTPEGRRKLR